MGKIRYAKIDDFKVNENWAKLMPPITMDDEAFLKEDIIANGIRIPLEVTPDMVIIDGHQRHRIIFQTKECDQKTIPYRIKDDIEDKDVSEYIIQTNFLRRHLTKMRKVQIAVDIAVRWGWFEEAEKRELAGVKVDPSTESVLGLGRTSERIAKDFRVSREAVDIYLRARKDESWDVVNKLLNGSLSQVEAVRILDKKANKEPKVKPPKSKFHIPLEGRKDLFDLHWERLGAMLWSPNQGDMLEVSVKYSTAKKKAKDKEEKTWKPQPFKEWACVHGVVGGCRTCVKDTDNVSHGKRDVSIKQDKIMVPVDKAEMSGFRILPDREMEPCKKCNFFDGDSMCTINLKKEEIPEGCRKWKKS